MTDDPLAPLLGLPGVAAAAEDAREAVDELRGQRVVRRRSVDVSAEASLHAARASAALAGADVPLAALRAGDPADPLAVGALRVAVGIGGLVDTWPRAPLQVLARLHVLAASGIAGPDELGRPRAGAETSGRLVALGRLVAGGSGVPAVVLAAVVHGELLAVAPFADAGGIVARAAARLTVIAKGLDPKALAVPEVGHLEAVEEYRAAAAAYGDGSVEGVAAWIVHCCTAVRAGAREGLAICEALRRG